MSAASSMPCRMLSKLAQALATMIGNPFSNRVHVHMAWQVSTNGSMQGSIDYELPALFHFRVESFRFFIGLVSLPAAPVELVSQS